MPGSAPSCDPAPASIPVLIGLKALSLQITLKTALEAAAAFAAGVFQPVSASSGPIRRGEDSGATRIIHEYGARLIGTAKNLREDALRELVSGYPSYQFNTDWKGAGEKLFQDVRELGPAERELMELPPPNLKRSLSGVCVQRLGRHGDEDEAFHVKRDEGRLQVGEDATDEPPHPSEA